MMLAQLENEVLLVVKMCLAHFVFALGVHELVPCGGELSCIAISNLRDYYPLFPYNIVRGCSHLVLKHQIAYIVYTTCRLSQEISATLQD